MPITALWSLIVSLILLALGLSLKLANVSRLLKLADKELDGLIKQIAVLKEKHDETVSRTSQFQAAETKEVIQEYELQIDHLADKVVELKANLNPWAKVFQHLLITEQNKSKTLNDFAK